MGSYNCALPGQAKEAVAGLAIQVFSMAPTAKFFQMDIWKPYTLGDARKQRRFR